MDFSKYEKPEYYVNRELSWPKLSALQPCLPRLRRKPSVRRTVL